MTKRFIIFDSQGIYLLTNCELSAVLMGANGFEVEVLGGPSSSALLPSPEQCARMQPEIN